MSLEFEQRQSQNQNSGTQSYARELQQGMKDSPIQGELLLHEQQLVRDLEKLGPKRLAQRRKEAQRLLRENGATHNVFGPVDDLRSWQFDPIPLVIGGEEWSQVEAGLIQRAQLLDLILADVYGAQTLIKKGLLPPELIFSHSSFLWPCVGQFSATERHLDVYSANIVKGTDGRFWVLEDRTQLPFGSGYALENRIVMARAFPQLFQNFQVSRLAPYFRALRNNLSLLARHNRADPRIVILTPGPEHEAYFEHAYLAAYLGYTLVQGGDLIVRDGCVWLKSVGGLCQVDVILRRLDDELCDPLELRRDSQSGVPGLLEVVRRGNVAVANPVGSSVLENPALLAFLPALCRYFLGEELRLPSLATWWCGQPREREFVLQNLDKLVIRPIHPIVGFERFPEGMTQAEIAVWRDRILAHPHLYIGQERAGLASGASFIGNEIEPRTSMLSTFLTAHEQTYVVMPGGLARVNTNKDSRSAPNHDGRGCKDTWVLTQKPEEQVHFWREAEPDQLIQPLLDALPSRAAENLFWTGRYAERTEATARLLRSILSKYSEYREFRDPDDLRILEKLLPALTRVTSTYPGFTGEDAAGKLIDPRAELLSLAGNIDRPGSLRSSLRNLARSAYPIRDLVPEDAWRAVDAMERQWHPKMAISQIGSGRLADSADQLILGLSAFSGLTNENMSRETAWLLVNIGRRLERALTLIELLRATLVPRYERSMEAHIMETVLSTSNSLIVFRRRYRSFMQLSTVLQLLLLDGNYPRALAYQLEQLQEHIKELPHEQHHETTVSDELLIAEALEELRAIDHHQLTQLSGSDRNYLLLEKLLVAQKERLERLSGVLVQLYFSPTQVMQQMGTVIQDKAS